MKDNEIIQINNLKKVFPVFRSYEEMLRKPFGKQSVVALDGVSLSIRKGELFGVLGPNGAGKTTLLKIMATICLPDSGTIQINGHDVVKEADKVRANIGYIISEERSFYWRLTGRQNLEFFAALQEMFGQEAKKRINEVLELVELHTSADRLFMNYSTGLKQRLSIARGLLTDPAVFLVDEATRGLDPVVSNAIKKFIKEKLVAQMGKTVIWVTNNAYEAESLCSRLAVLYGHKVACLGTPAEIKEKYCVDSFEGVFQSIVGDMSYV